MKKLFLMVCCAVITTHCFASVDTCKKNNSAFAAGESLTYVFSYHWGAIWLSAGEATMSIESVTYDNNPCYHITGIGKTYPSYDWFYKVYDTYETYMDTATLLPYKFIRKVDEGNFKIYNNVTFNQDAGKATSTHGTYNVPGCIQDVMSAIYYLRNTDMTKVQLNETIPITIFLDDSVYHLYVRYVGKEKIKTNYGEFNCLKIKPLTIKGTIFSGAEDMVVYISDDENKIPVLITSPITVGEIRADLSAAKGLRHPLNGKIKKKT
jgi:hypothetical protein